MQRTNNAVQKEHDSLFPLKPYFLEVWITVIKYKSFCPEQINLLLKIVSYNTWTLQQIKLNQMKLYTKDN